MITIEPTSRHESIAAAPVEPSLPAALLCDAIGLLVDDVTEPVPAASAVATLERVRRRGIRICVVHDGWPACDGRLRTALGPLDLVAAPRTWERTPGRRDEVRPPFVRRVCGLLGVAPSSCVALGARRPLLAAAAWAGARTVMVPNDATPLFDLRAQRHVAVDLADAIDGVLDGRVDGAAARVRPGGSGRTGARVETAAAPGRPHRGARR